MSDVDRPLTKPTASVPLETLAASVAIVSGLIRDAADWPDKVDEGHAHGCRELAVRYLRALDSLGGGWELAEFLNTDYDHLYPEE